VAGCAQAQLRRMSMEDGAAPVTLASAECIGATAVDGDQVYFSSAGADCAGPFELHRVGLDGSGPPERIAMLCCDISQLAIGADRLFWLDECGEVASLTKQGGEPTSILRDLSCPAGPQISGDQLHVVDPCQGTLYTVSLADAATTRTPFENDGCAPGGPASLAQDRISWVDECDRRIRSLPLAGGTIEAAGECVADLRTIDGELYFTRYCAPGVYRIKGTGAMSTVLNLHQVPDQFAADSSNLYWTSNGEIWRQRR
jgi:hypothetical protein